MLSPYAQPLPRVLPAPLAVDERFRGTQIQALCHTVRSRVVGMNMSDHLVHTVVPEPVDHRTRGLFRKSLPLPGGRHGPRDLG